MIGIEDAPQTFKYEEYYKILPIISNFHKDKNRIKEGKKVSEKFSYTSNSNSDWLSRIELQEWFENNQDLILNCRQEIEYYKSIFR